MLNKDQLKRLLEYRRLQLAVELEAGDYIWMLSGQGKSGRGRDWLLKILFTKTDGEYVYADENGEEVFYTAEPGHFFTGRMIDIFTGERAPSYVRNLPKKQHDPLMGSIS